MNFQAINEVIGQYQITKGITKKELRSLSENPAVTSLQFASPLSKSEYDNLETIVFSKRPDILLRVYGHYGETCNLNFIKRIPSLRKFSADSLMSAVGIENVILLNSLEVLGIGIYDLVSFDFLDKVNTNLDELYLYNTASKKPNIKSIGRFKQLKYLFLEGQSKGIEELNNLKNLEQIVLRSISTSNLEYLSGLPKLWSIEIKLGGIKEFNALKTIPNLKYLELWQVRNLNDLSFLSDLTQLQLISLESLKNVSSFPNVENLKFLRRVMLENMKGLKEIKNLKFCLNLEDFIFYSANNFTPRDIKPILENPNVKNVSCWFGSKKKNNDFKELAKKYNKTFGNPEFNYS